MPLSRIQQNTINALKDTPERISLLYKHTLMTANGKVEIYHMTGPLKGPFKKVQIRKLEVEWDVYLVMVWHGIEEKLISQKMALTNPFIWMLREPCLMPLSGLMEI